MRYKLIQGIACDGSKHIDCEPPVKIGQKLWPTVFKNVNNAFRCMAEFNGDMPYDKYLKPDKYVITDCECRAEIVEIE